METVWENGERRLRPRPLFYILAIAVLVHKALHSFLLLCFNTSSGAYSDILSNFIINQISLVPYVIFLIYVFTCYKKSRGSFLMPLVCIILATFSFLHLIIDGISTVSSYVSVSQYLEELMQGSVGDFYIQYYQEYLDGLVSSYVKNLIIELFFIVAFVLMAVNAFRNFASKALTIVSTALYVGAFSITSLFSLISYIKNYVDLGFDNLIIFMGDISQALLVAAIFVFAIRNGGSTAEVKGSETAEETAAESAEDEFPEFI